MPAEAIDYVHSDNTHTLQGAWAAFSELFGKAKPTSLLDVGCGTGTWLRAALDCGVTDILGVDGVLVQESQLHVPRSVVRKCDLMKPLQLGRKFDLAICVEVAEHLDMSAGRTLVDSLVLHSDRILFSTACPGQTGQHHVNCQWPAYWQRLFNDRGYACSDWVRWQIWNDDRIEPWYRQNIFIASRDSKAGHEPRIAEVVHPKMLGVLGLHSLESTLRSIELGSQKTSWYAALPVRAALAKIRRRFRKMDHRRG